MVPCANRLDNASMHDQPMPFDEFRISHHAALQRQREHLRDDAVAEEILREGSAARGWVPWDGNALVTQS
jgi:hypothetical protein